MISAQAMKWMYVLCAAAFAAVLISRLTSGPPPARERIVSTQDLIAFARSTLDDLQKRSIARNQEYCGVIYEDQEGTLFTSATFQGDRATCALDWGVPLGNHVVASFHTHAAYDPAYDSEVPSIDDMVTDLDARIDGFISTPGGRLWHIDWRQAEARQVCGIDCLTSDADYRPDDVTVPARLTLDDVNARNAAFANPY